MKSITAILAAALLMPPAVGYAQSLGDLAKKEKERREKVKEEAKVITNSDTSKYRNGPVTTGSLPVPAASEKPTSEKPAAQAAGQTKADKPESDEPTDLEGRTESYWRETMGDARKKVTELENMGNVLNLRLNDLQNRFYKESDGFQQQAIQREIQKTLYEQDKTREDLAKARELLRDLEKEARKSGALPGWIAGKNP